MTLLSKCYFLVKYSRLGLVYIAQSQRVEKLLYNDFDDSYFCLFFCLFVLFIYFFINFACHIRFVINR